MFKLNMDVVETYTFHFICKNNEDAEKLATILEKEVENYNSIEVEEEVVILFTDIDEMGETFPEVNGLPEMTLETPQYYFDQTLEVVKNSGIELTFIKKIIC